MRVKLQIYQDKNRALPDVQYVVDDSAVWVPAVAL